MTAMIPRYLQEFIREGKVVPFVGAGVSMNVTRADGSRCYPSWTELLGRAAARLREEHKVEAAAELEALLNKPDYLAASALARKALRSNWYRFLKSQLSFLRRDIDGPSLELARAIWSLGSQLIITTNYDRVLLWACPQLEDLNRWDIDAPYEQVAALRDGLDTPTVWHLHGVIDNVTKLILTPDGYRRLYPDARPGTGVDVQREHEAALRTLQHHLVSFSLLFIGFSLDDAAFLEQLHQINHVFDGAAATHYILVREREREAMADKIDGWGLPIDVVTFEDFGRPLIDRVLELASYTTTSGDDDVDAPRAAPAPKAVYRGAAGPQLEGPAPPPERTRSMTSPPAASERTRSMTSRPAGPAQEHRATAPSTPLRQAARRLYADDLGDRRAAASSVAQAAREVPLSELLAMAESENAAERAAAGIGLRTHLTLDPTLSAAAEVERAAQRGMADPSSRVRYRFVESLLASRPLTTTLKANLETCSRDRSATVASKAREVLLRLADEPDASADGDDHRGSA